jgi:hypothetical protein
MGKALSAAVAPWWFPLELQWSSRAWSVECLGRSTAALWAIPKKRNPSKYVPPRR